MKRFLSFLGLALIGCAGSPRHIRLGLPRAETAEIRGLDGESGSFGLPPPEFHVHFQALDGQSLEDRFDDGLPRLIEVLPGEHELRCWYWVNPLGDPPTEGTVDIRIDAQAGHVYEMYLDWGATIAWWGGRFTVEIRDITEAVARLNQEQAKLAQEEAARRRDARSRLELP